MSWTAFVIKKKKKKASLCQEDLPNPVFEKEKLQFRLFCRLWVYGSCKIWERCVMETDYQQECYYLLWRTSPLPPLLTRVTDQLHFLSKYVWSYSVNLACVALDIWCTQLGFPTPMLKVKVECRVLGCTHYLWRCLLNYQSQLSLSHPTVRNCQCEGGFYVSCSPPLLAGNFYCKSHNPALVSLNSYLTFLHRSQMAEWTTAAFQ